MFRVFFVPIEKPTFYISFAESCDALLSLGKEEDSGAYCVCKPNYVGDRCEFCGPGYYGQPETIGKVLNDFR